jgi:hypothetical protein
MNLIEKARGLNISAPTLFDFAVAGILFITFISNIFYQGTFFIFYSIFILILTRLMRPRRNYISVPLVLFTLWSLALVFARNNIKIVPNAVMNYYFNVSIMFEGFIYILFGVLLFDSIVRYSTNLKYLLFLLPVFSYPLYKTFAHSGRVTPVAALLVSVTIYLFLKRKFLLALSLSIASLITAVSMWKWIVLKFSCRPLVWGELLSQIKHHPWIGSGFNHTLFPDNMIYVNLRAYGWTFRHNDILSIGAYLGVVALLLIVWFLIQSIRKIGVSLWLIPFLTIVLTSFFQMTMFSPDKAVICIVICAVCVKETYKGEVL